MAYKTKLPVFALTATRLDLAPDFNLWMSAQHGGTWLDVFPLEEIFKDSTSKAPLFVDVGGGVGYQ